MSVTRTIYRARIRGIEDAAEFWKPNHLDAMQVRDVEKLVRECLDIRDFLSDWNETTWKDAAANKVEDFELAGQQLLAAMSDGLRIFELVRSCVREAQSMDYTVEGGAEFNAAEPEIQRMKQDLESRWPWVNLSVVQQSLEDINAGRVRTVAEVFRELQSADHRRGGNAHS